MFKRMGVPLLALSRHCLLRWLRQRTSSVWKWGAKAEAEKQGMPFLGEIPLDLAIRVASDGGVRWLSLNRQVLKQKHS